MRARWKTWIATTLCVAFFMLGLPAPAAHAATCANAIACENQLAGTPQSVWDPGTDDSTILGFATQMSVNVGGSISFKVKTDAKAYTIDVYRLGYYQGNGARKIASVPVSATLPQSQPACLQDLTTDLYDCGNWAVSATWTVPSTAVSGVYTATLTRTDTGGQSSITFVVRNDASHSDVVFQTSDTTWQAYNTYGGSSLYQGVNMPRGYKVSYNRPFITRDGSTMRDFVYANEYPTIRFLESNGIDVTYISGVDVAMGQGYLTNHKAYMSVGHDEYWSPSQRTAVTQARDAGVNLMFLSGNEVFWKTRWENSIDGSGTPYRTLVCYKDTKDNTQIDPVSPTPTWRDPRFAGSNPENSLTGTAFMMQGTSVALQVTADQGKLRMWRNTDITNLSPGTSATLGSDLIGYEADEILDNGYQPAGQIALSTTVAQVDQILQDFGNNTAPGTLTHHFSMYRAASGALVFSAGAIQYAWGLDGTHDLSTHGAIPEVQQATINLFADMGVQPTTLQPGLVAATASADKTAPVVSIAQPASSSSIPFGTQVTVSGTATDSGGLVAGVEVSVDGGTTWHPATGTTSWSYTGPLRAYGASAIQVRATDDSLNTSTPASPSGLSVTGPNTLFGNWVPANPDSGDTSATTLGVAWYANSDGYVNGIRFYKSSNNTGTHTGTLYSSTGTVLATGTFSNETATGWQTMTFSTPVAVTSGTTYIAAYYAPAGHYAYSSYFFSPMPFVSAALTALGGSTAQNGVYASGSNFPTQIYQQTNYFVDPVYVANANAPLAANAVSPVVGAGSVLTSSTVVGRFNKDPGDNTMALTVTDSNGASVAGTTAYDSVAHQLTFTPSQPLAYAMTFTATMTDAGLASPYSWQFTTVAAPRVAGQCPCTLFQDTDQPSSIATTDVSNLTLGVAVTPSQSGTITGIRYWKPYGSSGTHTVTLFDPSGTVLATATASSETSVGWQTATFTTAVSVSAGTTYTAAVAFPTGGYPYQYGTFTNAVTFGPLTAPANGGRYTYGTGMPTNAVTTSYYVDLVFVNTLSAAPVVVGASPGNGATSVPVNDTVTVTFNEPIASGSAKMTLTGPSGAVAGTVTEPSTTSRTFTPSASLAQATSYTLSVTGAATVDGVVQTQAFSESFTTSGVAACPCSLLETTLTPAMPNLTNSTALTLGLSFTPTVNGTITGLRYWRAAGNTGTHTGKLYAANGTVLASLTFVDGAQGWQQQAFASPVSVTAGTTYYATYYSPSGNYSATTNAFPMSNPPLQSVGSGGVYATSDSFPNQSYGAPNYFVDVTFSTTPVLSPPPTVVSASPGNGATSVSIYGSVTATYNETIASGSGTMTLTGPSGSVAGTVTGTSTTRTFTPSAALTAATTYTLSVTGATTTDGVVQTQGYSETFTTSGITACPCQLLESTLTPQQSDLTNTTGITLGLKFAPTVNGYIDGLRYWRAASNTGSHTGYLYAANGGILASVTFVDGVAGWTQAMFTTPVAVTAGTTYYATYYSPNGTYSATTNAFTTQLVNPPLESIDSGGVYASGNAFPNLSFGAPNYFVDVVYTPTPPADTAPAVTSVSPANGATQVSTATAVTVNFSGSFNASTVSIVVSGPSGAVVGSLTTTPTSATFTPTVALTSSATYTVTVNASSPGGTAMTPFTSSFTTGTTVNVASTTPATNATGVAVNTTIGVTFGGSLAPSSVSITLAPNGGAAVAGTLATTSTSATFTPSASLLQSTYYTATVNASSTSGAAMATYTWTFSTVSPAPVISSRSPSAGATGVAANTAVTVTFTTAVDPTKSTLNLVSASGGVPGTVSTTSTSVTFTPSAVLAGSTTYTATVGASSPLGTAMAPSSWTFTTESAPTVSAISPANGATGVTNKTTVKATFSKSVNQSTISVVVTDPSGTAVAGTLATTSTTGTFTPSALLQPGTRYSVAVSAKLADGLPSTPFTSSFTTGAAVSIFAASVTPTTSTQTTSAITVGVKFSATTRYWITGIKFYLPGNWTSTYTVSLWTSGGTKIASGSGSPTSATAGWRTVNVTTPYRIAANTTYVASVRALTGQYSSTPLAFVTSYTNGTMSVPASGGVTASNDVFPNASSTTNYFVDVVAAP